MTTRACWAAVLSLVAIAATGGCCNLDYICGIHRSCNSCSQCNSCQTCGSCGQCTQGGCGNSCGNGSCSQCDSCGSCPSCGTCGSGSCGSGTHCSYDWFLNLSWIKGFCHFCKPETFDDCGCGENYFCDWKACPPGPDPCNKCAGYAGCAPCSEHCYQASTRFGSVSWPPHDDGSTVVDGVDSVGQKQKTTTTTQ
jgi:hypothetical protein